MNEELTARLSAWGFNSAITTDNEHFQTVLKNNKTKVTVNFKNNAIVDVYLSIEDQQVKLPNCKNMPLLHSVLYNFQLLS